MGPKLAKAVLAVYIHKWNFKRSNVPKSTNSSLALAGECEGNSDERFGIGVSSRQSLSHLCENFVGKWVTRKSREFNHPVVLRVYTYRMLKARFDINT